ncbi:phosphate ABC transporter substrate-binding/OmpA family protein [Nostoc sp.]|uniref:phosphate ABC transporter substrate-binding/OmpA family protein n=1 Tax=Nostoc sp. TaxID=1180 RepID=UPI002FFAE7FE
MPLALIITAGLGICGFWLLSKKSFNFIPSVQNNITKTQQLTLLGDTFSGYSTFRSKEFKSSKESGVNLHYEDEFDQTKRSELLNQGKANLLVTTLDQFLKQKPQGKIVGLIDRTIGADAVVLNTKKYSNLKSLLDLNVLIQQMRSQGKQLSMTFAGDTPSEYLALMLSTKFEQFKLSDFQVNKVTDASEAWKLLQDPNQNVAVAVLWEPYITKARQQGYTVVLSSKDVPGAIVDVIVASNQLIQSQPEKISELLTTYYRRIDSNLRDTSQFQNQIAEDGKLSPSDANFVLEGIDFFPALEAKDWLTNGTLEKRIGSTAAVLTLAGKLNQVPENPKDLFTSEFITKAANNSQNLIELVRADNPELADRLTGKGKILASNNKLNANQIKASPNIGNLQVRGDVKFGIASAQLEDEGKQTLNQLAQEISEFNLQTVAVRVIGHTSQIGSADFNQKLSQQRAQVVGNYLRLRNIKHNIVVEGEGFSQLLPGISPNDPRNQRTEIRLVRIN